MHTDVGENSLGARALGKMSSVESRELPEQAYGSPYQLL